MYGHYIKKGELPLSKESLQNLRQSGIENVWKRYEGDTAYIAKLYDIAQSTVYNELRIHCIKTNQNYQAFLRFPHKQHVFKMKGILQETKVVQIPKSANKLIFSKKLSKKKEIESDIDFIINLIRVSKPSDTYYIRECAKMLVATIDQFGRSLKMLRINGKQKMIKDIRGEIKYGATPEDLAAFFGVSEEEFMRHLEARLGQTFNEYKRELMKNKSKRKRKGLKVEEIVKNEPEVAKNAETNEISETEVQCEEESLSEEDLEKVVDGISEKISELACEKLQLDEKLSENSTSISFIQEELEKIINQVQGYQESLKALEGDRETLLAKKEDVDLEILFQQEQLENARAELENAKEVKIICKSDAILISKDGLEPTPKDVEEKYVELSKDGRFDDYAIKHVRIAAKVVCIVELLDLMEIKYSVSYDDNTTFVKKIVEDAKLANVA